MLHHLSAEQSVPAPITIDVKHFFDLPGVERLKTHVDLTLSDHSYLPKTEDPKKDWVASVAVPAFKALAAEGIKTPHFCTIGTGAGLDALAAIEILNARTVTFTDIHDDVVSLAADNILNGLARPATIVLNPGVGDLLNPIPRSGTQIDLIYENLPNIPLTDSVDLSEGQASATFIEHRAENVPPFVSRYLISLHYLTLITASPLLSHRGRILSSIGGRIPLIEILRLASAAGYQGRILTYTWKVQSEPEEVIGGYVAWERNGMGPFHFYPVPALEQVFGTLSPQEAGVRSLEIEQTLEEHRISAADAFQMARNGAAIGHTVAVLESRLP